MKQNTIKSLIKIKNGSLQKKNEVRLIFDRFTLVLVGVLYKEGAILHFRVLIVNGKKEILILLGSFSLRNLQITSSSSKKTILRHNELCRFRFTSKLLVFSTNRGILTLEDCKRQRLGGELLFIV